MSFIITLLTMMSITATPITLNTDYTQTSVYADGNIKTTQCECKYHIEIDLIKLTYTEIGTNTTQYDIKSNKHMTLYHANQTAYIYDLTNGKFLHLIFNTENYLFAVKITDNTTMEYRYTLDKSKMTINRNSF